MRLFTANEFWWHILYLRQDSVTLMLYFLSILTFFLHILFSLHSYCRSEIAICCTLYEPCEHSVNVMSSWHEDVSNSVQLLCIYYVQYAPRHTKLKQITAVPEHAKVLTLHIDCWRCQIRWTRTLGLVRQRLSLPYSATATLFAER